MSISDVGYYLALLIKAEIGDVNKFMGGDNLCRCSMPVEQLERPIERGCIEDNIA